MYMYIKWRSQIVLQLSHRSLNELRTDCRTSESRGTGYKRWPNPAIIACSTFIDQMQEISQLTDQKVSERSKRFLWADIYLNAHKLRLSQRNALSRGKLSADSAKNWVSEHTSQPVFLDLTGVKSAKAKRSLLEANSQSQTNSIDLICIFAAGIQATTMAHTEAKTVPEIDMKVIWT